MPLEIRELVIKVTVNEQANGQLTESVLARKIQELEERLRNQCREMIAEHLDKMNER